MMTTNIRLIESPVDLVFKNNPYGRNDGYGSDVSYD